MLKSVSKTRHVMMVHSIFFLAKNNMTHLRHQRYPEIEQADFSSCTYAWGVNKRNKQKTFLNMFLRMTTHNFGT